MGLIRGDTRSLDYSAFGSSSSSSKSFQGLGFRADILGSWKINSKLLFFIP